MTLRQLVRAWHITAKDMRTYYLKPPTAKRLRSQRIARQAPTRYGAETPKPGC